MQDETSRSDLFVAIDQATRWVHLAVFPDKTAHSAQCFLQQVIDKVSFKINQLLTDNGKEFTGRYIPNGERESTGNLLWIPSSRHYFKKLRYSLYCLLIFLNG